MWNCKLFFKHFFFILFTFLLALLTFLSSYLLRSLYKTMDAKRGINIMERKLCKKNDKPIDLYSGSYDLVFFDSDKQSIDDKLGGLAFCSQLRINVSNLNPLSKFLIELNGKKF